jgi:hypothetical protein
MSKNLVQGSAKIGDFVTYSDMANQNGYTYEVLRLPAENVNQKWGWSKGYTIFSYETGLKFSDLRQRGWTFVTVSDLPVTN